MPHQLSAHRHQPQQADLNHLVRSAGAFRGVVEDSCTVAFTREDIPADYTTGGALAANWSEPASNFR